MASNVIVAHQRGAFAESASGWCDTDFIGCLDGHQYETSGHRGHTSPTLSDGRRTSGSNHKESTLCP